MTEKLDYLDKLKNNMGEEMAEMMSEEITKVMDEQRDMEQTYARLITERGELKGISNKHKLHETKHKILVSYFYSTNLFLTVIIYYRLSPKISKSQLGNFVVNSRTTQMSKVISAKSRSTRKTSLSGTIDSRTSFKSLSMKPSPTISLRSFLSSKSSNFLELKRKN
jgi:hypothetical protein